MFTDWQWLFIAFAVLVITYLLVSISHDKFLEKIKTKFWDRYGWRNNGDSYEWVGSEEEAERWNKINK